MIDVSQVQKMALYTEYTGENVVTKKKHRALIYRPGHFNDLISNYSLN
jgi:hypothetical protein